MRYSCRGCRLLVATQGDAEEEAVMKVLCYQGWTRETRRVTMELNLEIRDARVEFVELYSLGQHKEFVLSISFMHLNVYRLCRIGASLPTIPMSSYYRQDFQCGKTQSVTCTTRVSLAAGAHMIQIFAANCSLEGLSLR